ncbi:hypothetical protein J5N97_016283 [Dioscorea zingiberensis]|uniref:Uncharacterized protein n=1 Tax=Dioscorea zingiberensis TaxID=325984 RepID=A0A9D5CKR4_9LILI|nr:hypothetical protein J5N97_016283 [Dioscorea zingiberensis]
MIFCDPSDKDQTAPSTRTDHNLLVHVGPTLKSVPHHQMASQPSDQNSMGPFVSIWLIWAVTMWARQRHRFFEECACPGGSLSEKLTCEMEKGVSTEKAFKAYIS